MKIAKQSNLVGGLLAAALLSVTPRPAAAENCSAAPTATHSASDIEKRALYIRSVLASEKKKARYWNWGWGIGLTASGSTQLGVAVAADTAEDQRLFALNGVRPLVAASFQVIRPLRIPDVAEPVDGCEALVNAEAALEQAAKAERAQVAWFVPRAGAIVLNVAAGVALWAWGQETDAVIATAVGLTLSEVRFQTVPWGAVRALRRYRTGAFLPEESEARFEWALLPLVAGRPSGATLVLRY